MTNLSRANLNNRNIGSMNISRSIRFFIVIFWSNGIRHVVAGPDLPQTVANALVRIEVTHSPRDEQGQSTMAVGTGFVFNDNFHIATCLHLVYGAEKITVLYEGSRETRRARLERGHPAGDLALLVVDDAPPNVEPLKVTNNKPEANSDVFAWGYSSGMKALKDYKCRVRIVSGQTLRENLSKIEVQRLQKIGLYDFDLELIDLQGSLTTGCSGGPILTDKNLLAGIICGGREKGSASITWGVPAEQLKRLLTAPVGEPTMGEGATEILFSTFPADLSRTTNPSAVNLAIKNSGNYTFTHTRTRSLGYLIATADNQQQIAVLRNNAAASGILDKLQKRKLDIYECLETGAVIVMPQGTQLEARRGKRREFFADPGGGFEVLIRTASYKGIKEAFEGGQKPMDFELINDEDLHSGYKATIDRNFSDIVPWRRWDGVMAGRQSILLDYDSGTQKRIFGLTNVKSSLHDERAELLQFVTVNHDRINNSTDRVLSWGELMFCVQISGFSQGLKTNFDEQSWTKSQYRGPQ